MMCSGMFFMFPVLVLIGFVGLKFSLNLGVKMIISFSNTYIFIFLHFEDSNYAYTWPLEIIPQFVDASLNVLIVFYPVFYDG